MPILSGQGVCRLCARRPSGLLLAAVALAVIGCGPAGEDPISQHTIENQEPKGENLLIEKVRVTMDEAGNALVVWQAIYPGADRGPLGVGTYVAGELWRQLKGTYRGTSMYAFDVASAGELTCRMVQSNPSPGSGILSEVQRRSYSGLTGYRGFDSPRDLTVEGSGDYQYATLAPRIAVNASGQDCVVYRVVDSISVQQYDGAEDSTGVYPVPRLLGRGLIYDVAIDDAGTALVVWFGENLAGEPGLFSSRSPFASSERLPMTGDVKELELELTGLGSGVLAYGVTGPTGLYECGPVTPGELLRIDAFRGDDGAATIHHLPADPDGDGRDLVQIPLVP